MWQRSCKNCVWPSGWVGTGPGSYTGDSPTFTITANSGSSPITEVAQVLPILETLTVIGGTIGSTDSGPQSGIYQYGQSVTVSANQSYISLVNYTESGATFTGWTCSGNGCYSGSGTTYSYWTCGSSACYSGNYGPSGYSTATFPIYANTTEIANYDSYLVNPCESGCYGGG